MAHNWLNPRVVVELKQQTEARIEAQKITRELLVCCVDDHACIIADLGIRLGSGASASIAKRLGPRLETVWESSGS